MKPQPHWQVCRSGLARPDGARRWDLAYQFLLHWAMEAEAGTVPASLPQLQEEPHGNCALCPGLDKSPTADPDD